jgi:hypothetical protein
MRNPSFKEALVAFGIKKGLTPALIAAFVAIVIWIPADVITVVITVAEILFIAILTLASLARFLPVSEWPKPRIAILIWSTSFGAAVLTCLLQTLVLRR